MPGGPTSRRACGQWARSATRAAAAFRCHAYSGRTFVEALAESLTAHSQRVHDGLERLPRVRQRLRAVDDAKARGISRGARAVNASDTLEELRLLALEPVQRATVRE